MKNKKPQQNSDETTNTERKERLNRRRFVKGVAMGSVLAFGMGMPTPTTSQAGILGSIASIIGGILYTIGGGGGGGGGGGKGPKPPPRGPKPPKGPKPGRPHK